MGARGTNSRNGKGIEPAVAVDSVEAAEEAGLQYVNDNRPGYSRRAKGKDFDYLDTERKTIRDEQRLLRVKRLAIPPAWTDVWICPIPHGHLQATGRDARGRKQYRYHSRWRDVRDDVKYGRLVAFSEALPGIRRRCARDLEQPGLPREKVLAAVVQLLEKTLIRIGNEEYARDNGSIGLTTMRDAHAKVIGSRLRFAFKGKSGVSHTVDLEDRRLAKIVKACRELPGYELFQYVDADGAPHTIESSDVNEYLRTISGADFTAKDFRTWAGTVLAAGELSEAPGFESRTEANRNIVRAVETVAKRLGNTRAVCRKCYIHPAVLDAYLDGATIPRSRGPREGAEQGLARDERAVVRLIRLRLPKVA
jgi:DNA topoisomerase I